MKLSGGQPRFNERREHTMTHCDRGAPSLTPHGRSTRCQKASVATSAIPAASSAVPARVSAVATKTMALMIGGPS
jgi:hypothetical protein